MLLSNPLAYLCYSLGSESAPYSNQNQYPSAEAYPTQLADLSTSNSSHYIPFIAIHISVSISLSITCNCSHYSINLFSCSVIPCNFGTTYDISISYSRSFICIPMPILASIGLCSTSPSGSLCLSIVSLYLSPLFCDEYEVAMACFSGSMSLGMSLASITILCYPLQGLN